MSHDDLEIIAYKALTYVDACNREGVAPSAGQLDAICEVNPRRLAQVVRMLVRDGYLEGAEVADYMDGETDVSLSRAEVTFAGARFLRDDPGMAEARRLKGAVVEAAVGSAVALLLKASLGI